MKIRKTLFFLILFLNFNSVAQDLTGVWQGVVYIIGTTRYYVLTIKVTQNRNSLTGTSFTEEATQPIFALQTFSGTINNSVLNYEDVARIDSSNSYEYNWCFRYGPLTYDSVSERLYGNMKTKNCHQDIISIDVYRLRVSADTVICSSKKVNITATGQNLRWYSDSLKQNLIDTGRNIAPFIAGTTTLYATQTIFNTESTVYPVTIRVIGATQTQNKSICMGQSLMVGDTVYKTSGTYTKTFKIANGCDSNIITNLIVNPVRSVTQNFSICNGGSVVVGDTIYKTSGIYKKILSTIQGCDSTVTTNLTVSNVQKTNQSLTICAGQSISVGDTIYKTSGVYLKKIAGFSGCDSLVTTNLTVLLLKTTAQNISLCDGQTYTAPDTVYKTAGIYTKHFKIQNNCDTLINTLNLTVYPKYTITNNLTLCNGQSAVVGDTVYKTTGNYKKLLKSTNGCDSTILTNLKIISEVVLTQKKSICEGENIIVGDTVYKTAGIYIKKLKSISGCDSIISTELNVTQLDLTMPHDTIIRLGDSLELNPRIETNVSTSWIWSPKDMVQCDTCLITWAKPKTTTKFQLSVSDSTGKCKIQGFVTVKTKNNCEFFIPNSFSPNGDNINDVFKIFPTACVKSIKRFAVLNRWGNLITASNTVSTFKDELEIWDGKINNVPAQSDIYIYFVEVEYYNGETEILSGDIMLLK